MARARKLPSGNWRVQLFAGYDAHGKRIYESFTASTAAEANLMANRRKLELEQGIQRERTAGDMTVREAVAKYIDERDGILSPKTIREYKAYSRNNAQGIMDIKLKDLTKSAIQREINQEAKRLAPKTVKNFWALIKSAIKEVHPDAKYDHITLPQPAKKECNIPTNEELFRLLDAVQGKRLEVPVIIAATCGLRRGEITAIDLAKDVDYVRNTITVNKATTQNDKSEWLIKDPKTYAGTRTVEAPQWVIDKLQEARDSGYVHMTPAYLTSSFAKLCKKLDINIRFHDLRHYYASMMLSLNIPDKYAMKRMGHSTPDMLKRVYQHLMEDKDREVNAAINAYFEEMHHEMQHDFSENDE